MCLNAYLTKKDLIEDRGRAGAALFTYKDISPLKKSRKKNVFTVYKIVNRVNKTTFRNICNYEYFVYNLNKLAVSSRLKNSIDKSEQSSFDKELTINQGIHVYTKPHKTYDDYVLLECEALLEDLVAMGTYGTEAVFMKVTPKRAWTKKEVAKIKS